VTAPAQVGRHGPVAVIVAVSLALVTAVIDYYALTVALPAMADDFGVRPAALHWVITAYLLAFASLTIIGGRLGDAFGRRRVLILGVSIFGIASAAAGLAPSEEIVVVFRAIQAPARRCSSRWASRRCRGPSARRGARGRSAS